MNRYGAPTTYKRIRPDFGSGFILKRIYELTETPGLIAPMWPTKKDVYFGTQWYDRPGFASLLWSSLIKDGLIESDGGIQNYKCWSWGGKNHVAYRAAGSYEFGRGYTVRYHLTPKGRSVLFDMMDRVNAKNKTQPKLNTVGSVAEFDAKKDNVSASPDPIERDILEKEAVARDSLKNMTMTDLIYDYRDFAAEAERLAAQLLAHEHDVNDFYRDRINAAYNNICARREALAKEIERREKNEETAVRCVNLAADDAAGENQKLRAEKNDLNERLKKLVLRLEWLEHEVADAKNVLNEIIG